MVNTRIWMSFFRSLAPLRLLWRPLLAGLRMLVLTKSTITTNQSTLLRLLKRYSRKVFVKEQSSNLRIGKYPVECRVQLLHGW